VNFDLKIIFLLGARLYKNNKMKKRSYTFVICLVAVLVWSCAHQRNTKDLHVSENGILQQEDGTVSLKLDKAARYSDEVNPSNNTAEWNIVISKPGRFKVWLSSATKDTTNLSYANSVRINIQDDNFVVNPACDKIVQNSRDVSYPDFRADSYMGSLYLSEPGEYNIQVISEKVIAKNTGAIKTSHADDTMLMSVMLTPVTR
jgi:hypothetical protein